MPQGGAGDGASDSSSPPSPSERVSPQVQGAALLVLLQERLAQHVRSTLSAASETADTAARAALLIGLLHNCTLRIPIGIQDRLALQAEDDEPFYYHLLAEYYASEAGHDAATALQPLCVALWANDAFPALCALPRRRGPRRRAGP